MMHVNTKARFALFNRDVSPEDNPETEYPLMTGFIECAEFKLSVGAFLRVTHGTGKKFLSLVIGNKDSDQTFTGTLFRSDKPGKEETYYGYISEQYADVVNGETVYTTSDWQLGISAKIKAPEGKKKHIGGDVYPLNKHAGATSEQSPDVAKDVAF